MKSLALDRNKTFTIIFMGKFFGILSFTVLLSLAALVKIPLFFTPVPLTLQTLVVLLSGAVLGPVCGVLSVLAYIALGIFGAPVFANFGAGLFYLGGPTAGYLAGFLGAAWISGILLHNTKPMGIGANLLIMILASALIHLCGWAWLVLVYHLGAREAFLAGSAPFIGLDLAKSFMAVVIFRFFQSKS